MKKTKEKGANAERELVQMFWNSGLAAIRVAGSGSSRFPCPDVLASNGKKIFALECKSVGSDSVYLDYDKIVKLVTFAQKFNAIPYIGVRFGGKDWIFLDMAKIQYTKGKNFKVSKKLAYRDGKRFEELIGKFEQKRLKWLELEKK